MIQRSSSIRSTSLGTHDHSSSNLCAHNRGTRKLKDFTVVLSVPVEHQLPRSQGTGANYVALKTYAEGCIVPALLGLHRPWGLTLEITQCPAG